MHMSITTLLPARVEAASAILP